MARLCYGLLLLLCWCGSYAGPLQATACGHHDYPPWNWQQAGRIVGSCAEMASAAFAHAGISLSLAYIGPWPRCQAMVAEGRVDINICAFRNPAREAYAHFIPVPLGNNQIAAFVRRDAVFVLRQWEDLRGKRVGLVNGVSMGADFDDFLARHTRIDQANDFATALRKLALGRVDVVPFGREAGRLEVARLGLGTQLLDLPYPLVEGQLYISVSRRASWLLPYLPAVASFLQQAAYPARLQASLQQQRQAYLQQWGQP